MLSLMDWSYRDYYFSFSDYYQEIADTPICEQGINTRDLPDDCLETAATPNDLFRKQQNQKHLFQTVSKTVLSISG